MEGGGGREEGGGRGEVGGGEKGYQEFLHKKKNLSS